MTLLWVCLGAAIGAPSRLLLDAAVTARTGSRLPWGILVVNVVGSFLLGVLLGAAASVEVPAAMVTGVGIGLLGAFTTYSTFGLQVVELLREDRRAAAAVHGVGSVLLGWSVFAAGYAVAQAVVG